MDISMYTNRVPKGAKSRLVTNELIVSAYFWGFLFMRLLYQSNAASSTVILSVYTAVLLVAYCTINAMKFKYIKNTMSLTVLIYVVLFIDYIFRKNELTAQYAYEFTIFGAIPLFFLSSGTDKSGLLRWFSSFAVAAFLVFAWQPFIGGSIFSNYMEFGFALLLPAYIGIIVGQKFLQKKSLVILDYFCMYEIIAFSNRGVWLAIVCFRLFTFLVYIKPSRKKTFITVAALFAILLLALNIDLFVDQAAKLFSRYIGDGYSITKWKLFFEQKDVSSFFSGRLEIWDAAWRMIKESPFLGHGTAAFHAKYGYYTHNILLDLLVQYGGVGLAIALIAIFYNLYFLHKTDKNSKFAIIIMLCLWFPKLLLSSYLFKELSIWMFFGLSFIESARVKELYRSKRQP